VTCPPHNKPPPPLVCLLLHMRAAVPPQPPRCLPSALPLCKRSFTRHGQRLDVWRGRRAHLYTKVYVSLMSHASANVSLTGHVRPEGARVRMRNKHM